jgi:hypothetical protein
VEIRKRELEVKRRERELNVFACAWWGGPESWSCPTSWFTTTGVSAAENPHAILAGATCSTRIHAVASTRTTAVSKISTRNLTTSRVSFINPHLVRFPFAEITHNVGRSSLWSRAHHESHFVRQKHRATQGREACRCARGG